MNDVIEFVGNLPAGTRNQGKRLWILDEPKQAALQGRPGEWAILKQYRSSSIASVAASDQRRRWGPHGFEFAQRQGVVYVRYVGNGTQS